MDKETGKGWWQGFKGGKANVLEAPLPLLSGLQGKEKLTEGIFAKGSISLSSLLTLLTSSVTYRHRKEIPLAVQTPSPGQHFALLLFHHPGLL